MKGFSGDVTIKRMGIETYKLIGDLSYENEEIRVTAKYGMLYDGASVPRIFWRVIGSPFIGTYVCSATIHDALYTSQGLGILTKEDVDSLFLEMMEVEGVSWWKRNVMYYAVKYGGSEAWDSIEEDGKDYCEIHLLNSIS